MIRVPISLKFEDDLFYNTFIEPLRKNRFLSSVLVDLLYLYVNDASIATRLQNLKSINDNGETYVNEVPNDLNLVIQDLSKQIEELKLNFNSIQNMISGKDTIQNLEIGVLSDNSDIANNDNTGDVINNDNTSDVAMNSTLSEKDEEIEAQDNSVVTTSEVSSTDNDINMSQYDVEVEDRNEISVENDNYQVGVQSNSSFVFESVTDEENEAGELNDTTAEYNNIKNTTTENAIRDNDFGFSIDFSDSSNSNDNNAEAVNEVIKSFNKLKKSLQRKE